MKLEAKSLEQLNSILTENDKVVVTFTQPSTCAPCRSLKPHLEKVMDNLEDVVFVIVDFDVIPQAASEYGIMGIPTMKLYDNGQPSHEIKSRRVIPLIEEIKNL